MTADFEIPPLTGTPLTRMSLRPLLEARSIAIVGASPRPGSFGNALLQRVLEGGFTGPVHPVNPRYAEIAGLRCLPSLADLAEPPDLVLLAVGPERIEPLLQAAAVAGAGAAVIFGALREATTDARLGQIASEAGLVACGANCMGFLNVERSLRACAYVVPRCLPAGRVAFVSHSGSAFSAVAHNDRGVRFNVIISAGTEFSVSMDRYIDYALTLESTRAIGLFMETSRDPASLRAALTRAADLDIPVVCLKVGRSTRSGEFVATHTGALAGEDAAFDALFDACGVIRVAELDEMMDTLELLTAGRRPGPGGFAAVTDSGGERALLTDLAEDAGVPFAHLDPATLARVGSVLSPALVPDNPLDAWDALEGAEHVFTESLRLLHDDPSVAAVGLCVDLTAADDMAYASLALRVHRDTTKPFLVLSHLSSAVSAADAARLRAGGVPLLEGSRNGLAAVRNMLRYRDLRARPAVMAPVTDPETTRRWRGRLARPEPLTPLESFGLISDYGIAAVPTLAADSPSSAQAAARRIGWPVALKTAAEIGHKSDAGGVRLGIASPAALDTAYADLSAALGPVVTVSGMAPPGVELALGVVADPQFGPLVMVGAGGVLVEFLQDRVFGLPPLDVERALALLDRLKVRRLLDGYRSIPRCDIAAIGRAVVRLSTLAAELGDLIGGLDINPLIAGPGGCVAADVLVAPRKLG